MARSPQFNHETSRLRTLANDSSTNFAYTRHATTEMMNDQISKPDVEWVLKRSAVRQVEFDSQRNEDTWNVRGKDLDERLIEIVIVAYQNEARIKIITTFAKE